MPDNLKLHWHPDFGAVVCIEADSDADIDDVISACPFIPDSPKICYVRARRWKRFLKDLWRRLGL